MRIWPSRSINRPGLLKRRGLSGIPFKCGNNRPVGEPFSSRRIACRCWTPGPAGRPAGDGVMAGRETHQIPSITQPFDLSSGKGTR